MIENLQSIYINAAYVCAAGVGAAAVAYGAARGMKFLSGGVKCVTAVSLVGSLIFGGMVVTGVHIAAAKTNDTNQIENGKWRMENAGGRTTILRSPFSILHSASSVTDDDIARRWRVFSVSSNTVDASVFAFEQSNNLPLSGKPPSGAARSSARGAFRLKAGDSRSTTTAGRTPS